MQVCTSLQTDNHASTPPLSFLQAGCPSCRPTNSVKALKAIIRACERTKNRSRAGRKSREWSGARAWQNAVERERCTTAFYDLNFLLLLILVVCALLFQGRNPVTNIET